MRKEPPGQASVRVSSAQLAPALNLAGRQTPGHARPADQANVRAKSGMTRVSRPDFGISPTTRFRARMMVSHHVLYVAANHRASDMVRPSDRSSGSTE